MTRRALITGATGFVGSALVRALSERGCDVHALARSSSDRTLVGSVPVTWHAGDLTDGAAVERAVAALCDGAQGGDGAERPWVVHSGAVISYRTGDAELQRAVNVGGTRNVLAACRRHPVGRLLHVSSVVAVGHARPGETLDEEAAFETLDCDYMVTKRAAEELALAAADELDVVVVNPGAIFGHGHTGPNTVQMLQRIARGGTGPCAPPGALSVVGREDVVAGCVQALERGARGRRYLLTESVWELRALLALVASELGVPGPRLTVPRPLWRVLIAGASTFERALQSLDLGPLTPQSLGMLGARFAFDSGRARRELDWRPRPFEGVLRETVDWLRARGLL
jgi:nucleoside-diphosphate-sugar epimerase